MLDLPSFLTGFLSFPGLLYALLFVVLTVEIAYESGIVALLTLAVATAVSVYFGWLSVGWLYTHWTTALLFVVIYVPVGVLWAIIKWGFHVHAKARALADRIQTEKDYAKLYGRNIAEAGKGISREPPQVRDHKADIMRWMGWWPFSFVGTMLNDPFRRLFEEMYRLISTFLQEMSNRAFAHLQLPPPPVEDGAPAARDPA